MEIGNYEHDYECVKMHKTQESALPVNSYLVLTVTNTDTEELLMGGLSALRSSIIDMAYKKIKVPNLLPEHMKIKDHSGVVIGHVDVVSKGSFETNVLSAPDKGLKAVIDLDHKHFKKELTESADAPLARVYSIICVLADHIFVKGNEPFFNFKGISDESLFTAVSNMNLVDNWYPAVQKRYKA